MDIKVTLGLVSAFLLLLALSSSCLASHQYPRLGNDFTGNDDLEHCEMLSRWDVVVLSSSVQDRRPEMIDSLRSLNPDIKLLVYFPAACIWGDYERHGRIGSGYGDKIAACDWWLYDTKGNRIGYEEYAWYLNFSANCPEDEQGRTIDQWLAEYIADEIIASGYWDGLLIDGLFGNPWWINGIDRLFADPPASVDTNRDGIADDYESLEVWWGQALEAFLIRLRQEIGDSYIIVGNGSNYSMASYLNGGIREDFPNMHGDWEANMFAPYGYISMCNNYLQQPMNCSMILSWWESEHNTLYGTRRSASYERFVRFTLASALLGDGYYFLNGNSYNLWWEDYYDLDVGNPTSDAYLDSVWNDLYGCFSPVWKRDFENGVVYCNPFPQNITLDDGTWLAPEDGRIKTYSLPSDTEVEILRQGGRITFDQRARLIEYSISLYNQSENATYAYVWAHLTKGQDTLITGIQIEYLIGAQDTLTLEKFLRITESLPPDIYCLEVFVGGEDYVVVDRDTCFVERIIDFKKEQISNRESVGGGSLVVYPQPLVAPDDKITVEVSGIDSAKSPITVGLYDVRGRLVQTAVGDGPGESRGLEIRLGAEGGGSLVPGVYFVSVELKDQTLTRKIVLLRP